jgi:hypothetical protein
MFCADIPLLACEIEGGSLADVSLLAGYCERAALWAKVEAGLSWVGIVPRLGAKFGAMLRALVAVPNRRGRPASL